jgi:hypothetical protein
VARLVFVDGSANIVDPIDSTSRVVDIGDDFVPDGDDFVDEMRISDMSSTNGVPVSELWDAWQLVNELELGHLLVAVDDPVIFRFRVDGDGEELEGIVSERFTSSPVVIDGVSVPLVASDLPAVLVDCGDRGSWLVPLSWEVK